MWRAAGIDALVAAAVYAAAWVTLLWILGLYRLRARWTARVEIQDVGRAAVLLGLVTFSALFVFKLPDVSRVFLLTLFVAQVVLTVASRGVDPRSAARPARPRPQPALHARGRDGQGCPTVRRSRRTPSRARHPRDRAPRDARDATRGRRAGRSSDRWTTSRPCSTIGSSTRSPSACRPTTCTGSSPSRGCARR